MKGELDIPSGDAMKGARWSRKHVARVALGRLRDFSQPSLELDDLIYKSALGDRAHRVKAPPLTSDVRAAFALAEQVLDCHAVDIEVAVRYVGGKRLGRAEICGISADGDCRSTNEAMALCGAVLAALLNGGGK